MTIRQILNDPNAWYAKWFRTGQVCYQGVLGGIRQCPVEDIPDTAVAIGCAGWDEDGTIHWFGMDVDVGHGTAHYEDRDAAMSAALELRKELNYAPEVRFSKSGTGIHVRVPISPIPGARDVASRLAKWVSLHHEILADASPLGRQNFFFWAKENPHEYSFKLIADSNALWTPPPEALAEPKPIVPTPAPTPAGAATDRVREALAYLDKAPGAVSGSGGHDTTYHVACLLRERFGLNPDESLSVLAQWNSKCDPPWSQRELEHKVRQAADRVPLYYRPLEKQEDWYGELIKRLTGSIGAPQTATSGSAMHSAKQEGPALSPSAALSAQIEDEIAGRRFAASTGWPIFDKMSKALYPGTTTVIGSPAGSSKSFMIIQMGRHWLKKHLPFSLLMLEDTVIYHLRRAVAQEAKCAQLTDDQWCKANPDFARSIMDQHKDFMDELGPHIHVLKRATTKAVIEWLAQRLQAGDRLIAIDPITAREPTERADVDDRRMMLAIKELMENAQASLVMTTHPAKQSASNMKQSAGVWGDDAFSGGKEIKNLAHTAIFLEFLPEEQKVQCVTRTSCGVVKSEVTVNRKFQMRKTRGGRGQGSCIGYFFDPNSLEFYERGVVER